MEAYVNGIILDGNKNMTPQYGKTLLVSDGKIAGILEEGAKLPAGCKVIDLQGGYLLPGLINLHVHIPGSGEPKDAPIDPQQVAQMLTSSDEMREVLKKMYIEFAQVALNAGITTIRSVGGVELYDGWLRDEINAGKVLGPRVLTSNKAISVPGGHAAGVFAYVAHDPEEALAFEKEIEAAKPDLIKLMITGGVLDADESGEPALKMPPEMVKACCDEAHKQGFYVAAHVESSAGLKVALENGVDTIEHGAKTDEGTIRLFKEKKAAVITTISPTVPYALFDPSVMAFSDNARRTAKVVMDGIIECAKACLENDIPVGLGNDTGVDFITHYDFWRELVYFHKYCGVSNAFAIYTATKKNAEIAGIADETGTIEVGKSADFFVVEKNPLEDLRALRDVKMVAIKGQLIEHPVINRYEKVERELNKFL